MEIIKRVKKAVRIKKEKAPKVVDGMMVEGTDHNPEIPDRKQRHLRV